MSEHDVAALAANDEKSSVDEKKVDVSISMSRASYRSLYA